MRSRKEDGTCNSKVLLKLIIGFLYQYGKKVNSKNFNFYHLISEGGRKFTAVAQEIDHATGEEANRREIESEADGERQTIKYKWETGFLYVRFNVYFL